MQRAPIDRMRWEEVPDKPGYFLMFDKETGEQFDAAVPINEAFNSGRCRPDGWLEKYFPNGVDFAVIDS